MKRIAATLLISLVAVASTASGQTSSSAPASDNPQAGLDLSDPNAPPPLPDFVSRMVRHLVVLDGHRLTVFDSSTLSGVKYWAFCCSASWCPYCRTFTPELVDFYKSFKPQHPDFEIIFISDDDSEDAMLAYMQKDGMTWPAVRFDDIDDSRVKKFSGRFIPDLVLLDATGKVLSKSCVGSDYRGPEAVMQDIQQMVH